MDKYKYEFNNDSFEMNKNHREYDNHSWSVSFADMSTVLLCFFIIFYVVEKNYKRNQAFLEEGMMKEHKKITYDNQMQSFIEYFESINNIDLNKTDNFIEIHFPPAMFFKTGSTKITNEGKKNIDIVINQFKKLNKSFYLQVGGYTDNVPVRSLSKRWWKDNMQLSLARGLEVYYYILEKGIHKKRLIITGYGENRNLSYKQKEHQRRISIKIGAKIYENF